MTWYISTVKTNGTLSLQNTKFINKLKNWLPFESCSSLPVSHIFSKINVEDMPRRSDQDIVIVPITNPQNVSRHAPSSTRPGEIVQSHLVRELAAIVLHNPVSKHVVFENSDHSKFFLNIA